MATPSTRNVTETTVVPEAVVGVAVITTMRFTVVDGTVTVIEEPVAGALELEELELDELELDELDMLELEELEELMLLMLLLLLELVSLVVDAGVFVASSPPQAARTAESATMTHTTMRLQKIPLKVSYIAYSPIRQNTRRSRQ
jgi:hypothetical protein